VTWSANDEHLAWVEPDIFRPWPVAKKAQGRQNLHVAVDLEAALRWPDYELVSCFRSNGEKLPAWEIRRLLVGALRAGYDVYPPCDRVMANGHCAGHPIDEEPAS
jgi:hypothetical protein